MRFAEQWSWCTVEAVSDVTPTIREFRLRPESGRVPPEHGNRGIGHRQRTLRAVLDFGMQQVGSGARHLRAIAGLEPRSTVLALAHREIPIEAITVVNGLAHVRAGAAKLQEQL